jgi:hypothetical protein
MAIKLPLVSDHSEKKSIKYLFRAPPTGPIPSIKAHVRFSFLTPFQNTCQNPRQFEIFRGYVVLAVLPTPELDERPLSAVRDCSSDTFAATTRTFAVSTIRYLTQRRALVTGTNLKWYSAVVLASSTR